jgi:flagellar hook-length control protein FliK
MLQANEGQPRLPQALSASSTPTSQATTDLKEFAALLDSLGIELDQEGLAALFAQLQNTEQPSAEQLATLPSVLDGTTDASLSALDEIASRLSLVAAFSDSPAQSSASTTDTLSIADIAEQLALSHQDAAALVTAYQQLTANTDTTGSRQRVDTLNQQIAALLSHTPAHSPTEGKPATPGTLTAPTLPTPPPYPGISSEAIASALAVSSGASEGTARFGSAGELALNLPGTANGATPASTPIAASSSTSLPSSIGTPVSHPAWPSQLGQQLVQFAQRGGEQHIQMKLHPAELGPLSISLKMTEHGAQAHFLSAHAQVRQVVEQAIPQLREALAEQGISLGETSVGEQNASNEQAFAQQSGGGASGDGSSVEGDMGAPTSESTPVTLDGRVDLYA